MRSRSMWAPGVAALLAMVVPSVAGAASFVRLGDLPGGGLSSFATGVSADGSVVVGSSSSATSGPNPDDREAFRWTAATGMVGLGFLPGGTFSDSGAFGVSADGSVVV